MKMLLSRRVYADVVFSFLNSERSLRMSFFRDNSLVGEFSLNGNAFPELRYLLILYFYNEDIPFNNSAPHAITLEEYKILYRALFGRECSYSNKHTSLDHFRSDELYKRILNACALKLQRGGLCRFQNGEPDRAARAHFRIELVERFRLESQRSQAAEIVQSYHILRGFTSQTPGEYLGIPRLWAQHLTINGQDSVVYTDTPSIDWLKLLQTYPRLFISGISGSGKTTLLKCLALSPDLRNSYTVCEKRLAMVTRLYTKGEIEAVAKYSGTNYLFLLDGFNEIPGDSTARVQILNDISLLSEYPNVAIIVTSTSTHEIWNGFTYAQLGSVLRDPSIKNMLPDLLETPMSLNAYLQVPDIVRTRLNSEYHVLEYIQNMRFSSMLAKADATKGALLRIAYKIVLPALSESLCLRDAISFTFDDVQLLLMRIRQNDTEENAMLRFSFVANLLYLPEISVWNPELLENAFILLLEAGDVVHANKRFMIKHQKLRDYYAASYELEKLRVLSGPYDDSHIWPHFNLGYSTISFMREALEINPAKGVIFSEKARRLILENLEAVTDCSQFTSSNIKNGYCTAQFFEYMLLNQLYPYETNCLFISFLRRLTDWICEHPAEASEALTRMDDIQTIEALKFVFCKEAEIYNNGIVDHPKAFSRMSNSIHLIDVGIEVFKECPRLLHTKAKTLLYKVGLSGWSNDKTSGEKCAREGIALLQECYREGSFLSGNLLAFIHRTPVPALLRLIPDLIDYPSAFIINVSVATDPCLSGIQPSYARNEAIDAILLGEIKLNAFSGMNSFVKALKNEAAGQLVSRGTGQPGKKEIKFAKSLLFFRGTTLGDNRPLTAFYEFVLDWYSVNEGGLNETAMAALRTKYNNRLVQPRPLYCIYHRLVDLLALYWLNYGISSDMDYEKTLEDTLLEFCSRFKALIDAPEDKTQMDCDHPFYGARRLLHFSELLLNGTKNIALPKPLAAVLAQLKHEVRRFEKRYPQVILTKR